ncbi:MAG TPA: sensor domain-containing protein [Pseudonocardiaceae bacterium]|nr:sensor domain-containing protein [Pseudonocardiaceae bacterium]
MTGSGQPSWPAPPALARPRHGLPPRRSAVALRLGLLGQSLLLAVASTAGACLAAAWICALSVIGLGAGIPLTLVATVLVRWFAGLHRRWAAARLGVPVAVPYRSAPAAGWLPRTWLARTGTILRDPATWRDGAWLLLNSVTGLLTCGLSAVFFLFGVFYLSYPLLVRVTPPDLFREPLGFFQLNGTAESFTMLPLGLAFWVIWYVTAVPLVTLNARVINALLAPARHAELQARVRQLASSRAETIDSQARELRRIERDLHDGAQATLVSLGMSLGLAQRLMAQDPQAAQGLLAEARESTSGVLADLRDLVHGIHPPVLADRGLEGAVEALAMVNPVPTTVDFRLPGRLPPPVESAAYFAIAEALSNAIKHAGPRRILITADYAPGTGNAAGLVSIRVSDDGHGGASIGGGTGLLGIERRLSAFDGTLAVDSPPGGPTTVRIRVPCELS